MNHAVIMAGGSGTRFWPVSRLNRPKQLLAFGGKDTLLERTVKRVAPLFAREQMLIVTGDVVAPAITALYPDWSAANLLSEPLRRNTGPCAALAAKVIYDRDPEGVVALMPADHLILKEERFRAILAGALEVAARDEVLVTLGIIPTYPETGYGYIQMAEKIGERNTCPYHRVERFHEKPDAENAAYYLESGRFLWNSGIFIYRAGAFLRAVEQHLPDLFAALADVDGRGKPADIKMTIDRIYPGLTNVSIDVGIAEKLDNRLVFPADIGWHDVGSWTALRDLSLSDGRGNVAQGRHVSINSSGNTVYAQQGMVVTIGVENLIIVHTPDATLVSRRDDAQDVKRVFSELEKRGWNEFL